MTLVQAGGQEVNCNERRNGASPVPPSPCFPHFSELSGVGWAGFCHSPLSAVAG